MNATSSKKSRAGSREGTGCGGATGATGARVRGLGSPREAGPARPRAPRAPLTARPCGTARISRRSPLTAARRRGSASQRVGMRGASLPGPRCYHIFSTLSSVLCPFEFHFYQSQACSRQIRENYLKREPLLHFFSLTHRL